MTVWGSLSSVLLAVQFAVRMQGFHDLHPHPDDGEGFAVEGPDPVRVVLVGSGLGVGYGVRVSGLALSGRLGQTLAGALGRGVRVSNRTQPGAAVRKVVRLLEERPISESDAVVYLPTFLEATHPATRRWVTALEELLERLRMQAGPAVPIVLTGLPVPSAHGFLERIALPLVAAQNAVMGHLSARESGIGYVQVPGIVTLRGGPVFDTAYYQACAEAISQRLVELLPHGQQGRQGVTPCRTAGAPPALTARPSPSP